MVYFVVGLGFVSFMTDIVLNKWLAEFFLQSSLTPSFSFSFHSLLVNSEFDFIHFPRGLDAFKSSLGDDHKNLSWPWRENHFCSPIHNFCSKWIKSDLVWAIYTFPSKLLWSIRNGLYCAEIEQNIHISSSSG